MKKGLLILGILLGLIIACSKDEPTPTPDPIEQKNPEPEPEPVKSSEKQMTSFRFTGIVNNGVTVDIPGEIDEQAKAITAKMPSGTEITALEPEVEIPAKAVYEPTGPQDFSTPINYTVTAEDGTSRTYLVTVEVALSQKEILLLISSANPGNTLNWKETDNLADWEEVILDENGIITELNMSERSLTILPPEIGQLGSLQVLVSSRNRLSSLPPEIGQLGSLEILDLFDNSLSSLPPEIGQLGSLEILNLFSNHLRNLPHEIGQLGSLESLSLGNNFLSSLPPVIGQLGSLTFLGWSNNNLSSLPPEIGQLESLQVLFLSFNDLSSLPPEIKQLFNLRELFLNDNNLSQFNHVPFIPSNDITFGCSTETNLELLRLSGNPLEDLNQCICDLDVDMGGSVRIDVVPNGVDCETNNTIGN